jgi:formyl-CoA transferase
MNGLLHGIRVLDLTSYLAGPLGCSFLGDLGADVVKIEPPEGDMMRRYPSTLAGDSRAFVGLNRNKRSAVLDLKTPAGRAALGRLVATADVLVHNLRPGVPQRLGITYDEVRAIRPDIIYAAVSGYGGGGPYRDHPGFDMMLQAMSGIAHIQGLEAGRPALVRGQVVDHYAAALLAFGVAAALVHRSRTGEGQAIDVSLLRSALAMQSARLVKAESEPLDVPRDLTIGDIASPYATRDGFLIFQANTAPFWSAFCTIVGRQDLIEDPRYLDVSLRKQNSALLRPLLAERLATKTAAEWEALMLGKVPCVAVRRLEEMFDHPQVRAEGLLQRFRHGAIGDYLGAGAPVGSSLGAPVQQRPAPRLGEHTAEVLAEVLAEAGLPGSRK